MKHSSEWLRIALSVSYAFSAASAYAQSTAPAAPAAAGASTSSTYGASSSKTQSADEAAFKSKFSATADQRLLRASGLDFNACTSPGTAAAFNENPVSAVIETGKKIGQIYKGKAGDLQGLPGGNIGASRYPLGTQCTKVPPVTDDISCTNPRFLKNGSFSTELLKPVKERNDKFLDYIACKQSQLEQLQDQLHCYSNNMSALAQQINSLQDQHRQGIEAAEKVAADLQTDIDDRTSQLKEVGNRLNGDPAKGTMGLLKLESTLNSTIGQNQKKSFTMKKASESIQKRRLQLDEQVKYLAMGRAMDCMNQKGTMTCPVTNLDPATGKTVTTQVQASPEEWVVCSTQAAFRLQRGNTADLGGRAAARAQQQADRLKNILKSLRDQAPNITDVTPDAQGQTALSAKGYRIPDSTTYLTRSKGTLDTITAQLRSQGVNFDVSAALQTAFNSCYDDASVQAAKTAGLSKGTISGGAQYNSHVFDAYTALQNEQDALQNDADIMTGELDRTNQAVAAELAQLHVNPPTARRAANCSPKGGAGASMTAAADAALCKADDARASLENVLTGFGAGVTLQVPATKPQNILNVKPCSGVHGCIVEYRNVTDALNVMIPQAKTVKDNKVKEMNSWIDGYTSNMAKYFNPQSKKLQEQLNKIVSSMSKLGVSSDKVKVPDLMGASLKPDPESKSGVYGVPKPPDNDFLKVISSQMQPKLPDINSTEFKGLLTAGSDDQGKGDDESKAEEVAAKISGLDCKKDETTTALKELDTKISDYSNCLSKYEYCADAGKDELDVLVKSINAIPDILLDRTKYSNINWILKNGVNNSKCPQTKPEGPGQNTTTDCSSQAGALSTKVQEVRSKREAANATSTK